MRVSSASWAAFEAEQKKFKSAASFIVVKFSVCHVLTSYLELSETFLRFTPLTRPRKGADADVD